MSYFDEYLIFVLVGINHGPANTNLEFPISLKYNTSLIIVVSIVLQGKLMAFKLAVDFRPDLNTLVILSLIYNNNSLHF
jgi:hypothetical protein